MRFPVVCVLSGRVCHFLCVSVIVGCFGPVVGVSVGCLGDEPLRRWLQPTAVSSSSSSISVGTPVEPPVWDTFFFGPLGTSLISVVVRAFLPFTGHFGRFSDRFDHFLSGSV